jgi:hypothetical protein
MKALSIHIATPCHEDWQQMTPVDKGRFCQSCAKQVVDFSAMTDQQILNYISNASGSMCGRFAGDQLQRPLQPVQQQKKKAWWIAAMMPLLLVFEKSAAQKKKNTLNEKLIVINEATAITGLISTYQPANPVAQMQERPVCGRITDTMGRPISFASILVNGKYSGINSGADGLFTILTPKKDAAIFFEITAIGYETQKIDIVPNKNDYAVTLNATENNLKPVVVTSGDLIKGDMRLVCSYRYSTKGSVRNLFVTPPFKVSPNPVQRGSAITVDVNKQGIYSIQLFDNNGKILLVQNFNAAEGVTKAPVTIPASAAAGMYYIRLFDEKNKKQYTDKIIVM